MPPSSPIDVREIHPLLHVYLESCLVSCIIFGCLFIPWVVQLLGVILPMWLQSHSALTVLPLLFYWGLCVQSSCCQWVSPLVLIKCWHKLSENSHTRPLAASLWLQQYCGFGSIGMANSYVGWPLDGLAFSLFSIFVSVFPLDRNISGFKILSYTGDTMMQTGDMTIYLRLCLQVLYLLSWILLL